VIHRRCSGTSAGTAQEGFARRGHVDPTSACPVAAPRHAADIRGPHSTQFRINRAWASLHTFSAQRVTPEISDFDGKTSPPDQLLRAAQALVKGGLAFIDQPNSQNLDFASSAVTVGAAFAASLWRRRLLLDRRRPGPGCHGNGQHQADQ
jgi:hypothetical protein